MISANKIIFAPNLLLTLLNLLLLAAPFLNASRIPTPLPSASSTGNLSVHAPQGMLTDEKIRLGSMPPSCHNRCNACNPCTAVQVPTLPGRDQLQPGASTTTVAAPLMQDADDSYKRYPNYKPLGWKCRCGDRLFNP